jgi:hypothetical protein
MYAQDFFDGQHIKAGVSDCWQNVLPWKVGLAGATIEFDAALEALLDSRGVLDPGNEVLEIASFVLGCEGVLGRSQGHLILHGRGMVSIGRTHSPFAWGLALFWMNGPL